MEDLHLLIWKERKRERKKESKKESKHGNISIRDDKKDPQCILSKSSQEYLVVE